MKYSIVISGSGGDFGCGSITDEQYEFWSDSDNEGYLSDALVNYLALLGWATSDSQQLFKFDELIQKFELEKCSSSASIFDDKKLLWMNGEYMRAKSLDDFVEIAKPLLKNANLIDDTIDKEYLKKVLALEQEKVKLKSIQTHESI